MISLRQSSKRYWRAMLAAATAAAAAIAAAE